MQWEGLPGGEACTKESREENKTGKRMSTNQCPFCLPSGVVWGSMPCAISPVGLGSLFCPQ